jgi:hypothetical protein
MPCEVRRVNVEHLTQIHLEARIVRLVVHKTNEASDIIGG